MRILTLVLLVGLAACDSGGGKDGIPDSIGPISCAGLTGASASITINCASGCGVDFEESAMDGDLGSYAVLDFDTAAGGSVSLRSTAQDGVTYPAGTPAAVVWAIERDGNSTSVVTTISTYLDGALQETGNAGGESAVDGFDREAGRSAIGTNLPFDAIEMTYGQSGSSGPIEVRVHEFCTSTN
jgi:hypothetical protein